MSNSIHRTLTALGATMALHYGSIAQAGTITIGFESGPYAIPVPPFGPNSGTNNFSTDHFVFSPGCHFDWLAQYGSGQAAPYGHWLGFDSSGCGGPPSIGYNTDYLGPAGSAPKTPTLFVQHESGALFTIESLVFAAISTDAGGLQVRSSKGGFYQTSGIDGMFTARSFSGSQWSDIEWLEFTSFAPGVPLGFDNLVLSSTAIPEPGSIGLVLAAALGLIAARRRPAKSKA